MKIYRKVPILVKAERYRRGLEDEFVDGKPILKTLEGKMFIEPEAFIVTGIDGERYPVKGSIFSRTFEEVPQVEQIGIEDQKPTESIPLSY